MSAQGRPYPDPKGFLSSCSSKEKGWPSLLRISIFSEEKENLLNKGSAARSSKVPITRGVVAHEILVGGYIISFQKKA